MPEAAPGRDEVIDLPLSPPSTPPQRLCASSELAEKGRAIVFDVIHFREPARAFALRFDGRVVAYLNRCVHVPTELDWQPGEFLDSGREFILCSIHGAAYEPRSGRCIGGPCASGRLTVIEVEESDGIVSWLPTRFTRPVPPPTLEPTSVAP
jgi:nitrite reductase/ring-hydroxylating ferredoxin subunit